MNIVKADFVSPCSTERKAIYVQPISPGRAPSAHPPELGQRGDPVPSPPDHGPRNRRGGTGDPLHPCPRSGGAVGPFYRNHPPGRGRLGYPGGHRPGDFHPLPGGKTRLLRGHPGGGLPPALPPAGPGTGLGSPSGLPPGHRASRYGDPPGRLWRLCRCRVRRGIHDRD